MNIKLLPLILMIASPLFAEDKGLDPFVRKGAKVNGKIDNKTKSKKARHYRSIRMHQETYSLPLAEGLALMREKLSDKELYQKMLKGVKDLSVKNESTKTWNTFSGSASRMKLEQSNSIPSTELEITGIFSDDLKQVYIVVLKRYTPSPEKAQKKGAENLKLSPKPKKFEHQLAFSVDVGEPTVIESISSAMLPMARADDGDLLLITFLTPTIRGNK